MGVEQLTQGDVQRLRGKWADGPQEGIVDP